METWVDLRIHSEFDAWIFRSDLTAFTFTIHQKHPTNICCMCSDIHGIMHMLVRHTDFCLFEFQPRRIDTTTRYSHTQEYSNRIWSSRFDFPWYQEANRGIFALRRAESRRMTMCMTQSHLCSYWVQISNHLKAIKWDNHNQCELKFQSRAFLGLPLQLTLINNDNAFSLLLTRIAVKPTPK